MEPSHTPTVILTPLEQQIFQLLLSVGAELCPEVTLRAAGGWVRDKLMGRESHDLDVALDHISGYRFGQLVLNWMSDHHLGTGTIAKVEANPEQSKHLETAIITIYGIPVDLVQLRRETYTEDSRIPTIEVGIQAAEDALRRDFTINALFYNLHTQQIEDYVGGVQDLQQGIVRSPIAPRITFLQDPLRILRAIRFTTKYNLTLDCELIVAANQPEVQEAFRTKITRERIWTELVGQQEGEDWKLGILSNPNFARGARLLQELGLRDLLFAPQPLSKASSLGNHWTGQFVPWDSDQNNPHHNLSIWDHTLAALEYLQHHEPTLETLDRIVLHLSLLLHDIGKCDLCSQQTTSEGFTTYHGHELSSAIMVEHLFTALKVSKEIKERVVRLVKNHMRLHLLPRETGDAALRRLLREMGNDWHLLVLMSQADAMGKRQAVLDGKYQAFDQRVKNFVLAAGGKNEIPLPINGHDVINTLKLPPGKQVGVLLALLREYMLDEPDLTKEEALEFVKNKHFKT